MRLLRAMDAVHASRFDEKKLDKCIKYILTCPLWLQVYVSSVNRSIVNRLICNLPNHDRRCTRVTYDVLPIFPRLFDRYQGKILIDLCTSGNLRDLLKVHSRFEWSVSDNGEHNFIFHIAFKCACKQGHLHVAKWLYTAFQRTLDFRSWVTPDAFHMACVHGHLDVAKWLHTVYQLTIDKACLCSGQTYCATHSEGYQNVCDWLVATFGESVNPPITIGVTGYTGGTIPTRTTGIAGMTGGVIGAVGPTH